MATKIIAIERTGTGTSDFTNWEPIAVRDEGARTKPVYGSVHVHAIGDDGSRHTLFQYYSGELTFPPCELEALIGITPEDAMRLASDLRARRDLAFLQS